MIRNPASTTTTTIINTTKFPTGWLSGERVGLTTWWL